MKINSLLHTSEELEQIAKTDINRFKEISMFYFENNLEFFEKSVLPIMEKLKRIEKESEKGKDEQLPDLDINEDLSENSSSLNNNIANEKNIMVKNKKKKKLFLILSLFLLIIISLSLAYYFLLFNNNYRQAVRHLRNKEFNLALDKLNYMDTLSEQFQKNKSKYFYAKGGKEFNENNFIDAYLDLLKVDDLDEFYSDAKFLLSKINTDPNIIYQKGIEHINTKEYDFALNEFKKVKTTDNNYINALSKLAYINGLQEFNLGNYKSANDFFSQVNKTDEYYSDILKKQPKIEEYLNEKKDEEANQSYAKFLIRISDEIQDEYQLMNQKSTFDYTKNTYLTRLMSLRSELNTYSYDVKNKDKNLLDFKKTILSWINSYIKYGEEIGDYGFKSNYVADRMWSYYGYELREERSKGEDFHSKVLKKIKNIKTLFNLN